jgi:putative FmdB family regulatory protein
MPIYEYRCSACGFQKEFLQKVSDARLTTCPGCGKETLGKMVTAAGFQLKGSGWYATDFKGAVKTASGGEAPRPDAKGEGAPAAKSEAKPEAKSDAKSETKSDAASGAKPDPSSGAKPASTTPSAT